MRFSKISAAAAATAAIVSDFEKHLLEGFRRLTIKHSLECLSQIAMDHMSWHSVRTGGK